MKNVIFPSNNYFLEELLEIEDDPERLIFYEDTLGEIMMDLSSDSRIYFIKTLIPPESKTPIGLPPYQLDIFFESAKETIARVCQVL